MVEPTTSVPTVVQHQPCGEEPVGVGGGPNLRATEYTIVVVFYVVVQRKLCSHLHRLGGL